jgi:hypothetical protein
MLRAVLASSVALMMLLASQGTSRTIEVELVPTGDPQIAIWLEDANGRFVDTLMVTRLVGTFGLGNRPGRRDLGGGYLAPYGRREMTLPVWAHRRGVEYDRFVFQDCKEGWLGWHEATSSSETYFCRPLTAAEMSVDAVTCPTTRFATDKGMPHRLINTSNGNCQAIRDESSTSLYPPRNDIYFSDSENDWSGILTMRDMNDLDAVSRATPREGELFRVGYVVPSTMATGDYVVWIEVNQEYDTNAHHAYDFFVDAALRDYGIPNVGQPSIVWQVPITLTGSAATFTSLDYAGYGAPDGQDGELRPPDHTITTGVDGTGAGRLSKMRSATGESRVRVRYSPTSACVEPQPIFDLSAVAVNWETVEVSFTTANDASFYEIRYAEARGSIPDEAAFLRAIPGPDVEPKDTKQFLPIEQLQAERVYTVAVRSHNLCGEPGRISRTTVQTPIREYATVDACFIATAAYGSKHEPDVVTFRAFRDRALMTNAPGRWLVETYYALSPPLANVIRDEPWLRKSVRTALSPLAWAIRTLQ